MHDQIPRRRALAVLTGALVVGLALPLTLPETAGASAPSEVTDPPTYCHPAFAPDGEPVRMNEPKAIVLCRDCGRRWRWESRPGVTDDCEARDVRRPVRRPGDVEVTLERVTALHHLIDGKSLLIWVHREMGTITSTVIDRLDAGDDEVAAGEMADALWDLRTEMYVRFGPGCHPWWTVGVKSMTRL